jgi:hypothetical protein
MRGKNDAEQLPVCLTLHTAKDAERSSAATLCDHHDLSPHPTTLR